MAQMSLFDTAMTPSAPQAVPQTLARMVSYDSARRQFISEFNHVAPHFHRMDVFRDFLSLAASELDLARVMTEENRIQSAKTCERYKPEDLERFKTMFCMMVMALDGKFHDFLGSVFMESELGNGRIGQFFTPYHISSLMAKMLVPGLTEKLEKKGFVTLDESTSGAGGMVIAYAEAFLDAGFNPSTQLYVSCTDLDAMAADMTFIQLSLLGIAAEVKNGNTLSGKIFKARYTPVYYFNNWEERLKTQHMIDMMRQFFASMH
ncbi:N-6 DNA methylase [Pectobacterium atrosepticum]|uniref:N-6 DNA methylase n=1 Tax=Pectobacterium atrosepticum TaxID=29471 RepID=UPI003017C22D